MFWHKKHTFKTKWQLFHFFGNQLFSADPSVQSTETLILYLYYPQKYEINKNQKPKAKIEY